HTVSGGGLGPGTRRRGGDARRPGLRPDLGATGHRREARPGADRDARSDSVSIVAESQAAAASRREARRNWLMVGGLVTLAVLIDLMRQASGDGRGKRKR